MRDAQLIRLTAEELLPHVPRVAERVRERMTERDPSLTRPEATAALRATSEAGIVALLSTMAFGGTITRIELSEPDRRLMDLMAEDPAALPSLLRIYRVGGEELWQVWSARVARRADDVAQMDRVGRATSAHVSSFVDRLSEEIARRWVGATQAAGGLERRRTTALRALLAGEPAELADLAHPLERAQVVLALRRVPGTAPRVLLRAARLVAEELGDPPQLAFDAADGTALLWFADRKSVV